MQLECDVTWSTMYIKRMIMMWKSNGKGTMVYLWMYSRVLFSVGPVVEYQWAVKCYIFPISLASHFFSLFFFFFSLNFVCVFFFSFLVCLFVYLAFLIFVCLSLLLFLLYLNVSISVCLCLYFSLFRSLPLALSIFLPTFLSVVF